MIKKEDDLTFVCYFYIIHLYKQTINQTKYLVPLLLTFNNQEKSIYVPKRIGHFSPLMLSLAVCQLNTWVILVEKVICVTPGHKSKIKIKCLCHWIGSILWIFPMLYGPINKLLQYPSIYLDTIPRNWISSSFFVPAWHFYLENENWKVIRYLQPYVQALLYPKYL